MTDNIVDITSRQPHISGPAKCLACRHEWVAVALAGTDWLECPECSLVKGAFMYAAYPCDYVVWECKCGNDLFYLTAEGALCPNCGARPKP